MKRRNHTFDFLCGLCIIRMVTLHTLQFTGFNHEPWWKAVMDWSFFLMCFFFFKAGYFNRSVGGPTLPYIKDRTKRLFVPYVTCGMIGATLFWVFALLLGGRYSASPLKFQWSHLWKTSDFYGNSPMWFLLSFYVMYLVVHFIGKNRLLRLAAVSFPMIGYVLYTWGNPLWLNLSNVFMGVFFFYLGHCWHLAVVRLGRRRTFILSVALVALFAVGNVCWHGVYTMHSNLFTGNPWGAVFNTTLVVCGLSGLFISVQIPRVPLVNFIGEHSMVYFVLHFPVLFLARHLNLYYRHSMIGHANDAILTIILVFAVCSWLVPYFEKVPWLSGRWGQKPEKHPEVLPQRAN